MTGLITGVADRDYHADRVSLSSTGARKLLACPARFRWDRDNQSPPSKAFDIGRVVHTLVLGEGGDVVVVDAENWMTKAAKEQRAAAYESGATPLLTAEYDAALAMRDAVMAHPVAAELFSDGVAEQSGWWADEDTGITLRFRPDWMGNLQDWPVCGDLKTTVSADPQDFARSVVKFGYGLQAAWYLAGLAAHGVTDARFVFVCVEKSPPYPVAVIELDAEAIAQGRIDMRRAIDLYKRCLDTDTWPAYGDGIHTISLPPWATRGAVQADADNLIAQLEVIA